MRTFISTKAPMLDPEGKVIGLIGITRDMTDKKNDELALKESQRKFKSLYDNTFETITIYEMVYDQEGKIVDWILRDNNRAAQIYFGKPLESIYGKKVSELFGLRNMDQFILKSREVMATGHGEMSETNFQWNGRYYMSSMFPIGTNLLAMVGLDISDRKGAEEALRRANKKLGLLSGVTRHDMANQLMVVSGIVSLMEMDKDRRSPDHLVKLTRSIAIMKNQLEFMKQYQEIGVMAPEWQNLHHLVEKAVKQLPLGDMEVLEEKTDLSVRADPMFEKVVYNLVENVIRHSDGAKHLHISVAEKDGSISLVFQDDGRGVTSKEREHLFQSGHGKNTGFGLFLSKEILEITGLTITEEDTEGKGAKFSVGVPLGMYRRQVRDHTLPDE